MFQLIYKPKGVTSFKAINTWAREQKIDKIGHSGTLDPHATGLLLVATDADTRLIENISNHDKEYHVTFELGYETDSLDITGNVTNRSDIRKTVSDVVKAINSFDGKTYNQMPPAFSAKKINGKKAYELAREGKEVELKPCQVTIHKISEAKALGETTFEFKAFVSKGTYIRSLVKDMLDTIGLIGTMTELERTKVHSLDRSFEGKPIPWSKLIDLPIASGVDIDKVFQGIKGLKCNLNDGDYALVENDDIVGVINVKSYNINAIKLLGNKRR